MNKVERVSVEEASYLVNFDYTLSKLNSSERDLFNFFNSGKLGLDHRTNLEYIPLELTLGFEDGFDYYDSFNRYDVQIDVLNDLFRSTLYVITTPNSIYRSFRDQVEHFNPRKFRAFLYTFCN